MGLCGFVRDTSVTWRRIHDGGRGSDCRDGRRWLLWCQRWNELLVPRIITDSFGGLAPLQDGLGFLDGSACPHYDGEVVGKNLVGAVSSRPFARAYRVELRGAHVAEEELQTRFLGV